MQQRCKGGLTEGEVSGPSDWSMQAEVNPYFVLTCNRHEDDPVVCTQMREPTIPNDRVS